MAVAGEGIKRHIGDDADFGNCRLDRTRRLVDHIVRVENVRAGDITLFHGDVREGRQRRNAKLRCPFGFLHGKIHRHALDAGHGGNVLGAVFALYHEDRPDQVVHRQPCFLDKAARPVGLAHAAQAARTCDFIDRAGKARGF